LSIARLIEEIPVVILMVQGNAGARLMASDWRFAEELARLHVIGHSSEQGQVRIVFE